MAGVGEQQITPLHVAACVGNPVIAQLLVAHGADVNARTRTLYTDGAPFHAVTPLHCAIECGHPAVVRVLIRHGAEISFHDAVLLSDRPRVLTMLNAEPSVVDTTEEDGWTPLLRAVYHHDLRMAALLVAHGASVEAEVDVIDGVWTPLSLAIDRARKTGIAEFLLNAGADPNHAPGYDDPPFYSAIMYGDVDLVRLMLKHHADIHATFGETRITPLIHAIQHGAAEMVMLLLEAGADANERGIADMTPLLYAFDAEEPCRQIVQILLACGANPDAPTKYARTPRGVARQKGLEAWLEPAR